MKNKLLQSILFTFILSSITFAQIEYVSFGGYLGMGEIRGNSSPVTSAGTNLFIDVIPWFSDGTFSIRTGFLYAQKVERFLPENRTGRDYPFIKSYWMKGMLKQIFSQTFYLEEGAGIIYLNDRTFSDVNSWQVGTSFNALAGIDLRDINSSGFSVGFGLDYGITFTSTTAGYYLVYGQLQYFP
jgi:hypothetical protein